MQNCINCSVQNEIEPKPNEWFDLAVQLEALTDPLLAFPGTYAECLFSAVMFCVRCRVLSFQAVSISIRQSMTKQRMTELFYTISASKTLTHFYLNDSEMTERDVTRLLEALSRVPRVCLSSSGAPQDGWMDGWHKLVGVAPWDTGTEALVGYGPCHRSLLNSGCLFA